MSLYVKYLVCYDISNTRTRSKFFDFLKDLGLTPIQKIRFLRRSQDSGGTLVESGS